MADHHMLPIREARDRRVVHDHRSGPAQELHTATARSIRRPNTPLASLRIDASRPGIASGDKQLAVPLVETATAYGEKLIAVATSQARKG